MVVSVQLGFWMLPLAMWSAMCAAVIVKGINDEDKEIVWISAGIWAIVVAFSLLVRFLP